MDADESARLHALEATYNRSLGAFEQQLKQQHEAQRDMKDWMVAESKARNELQRQVDNHIGGHRAVTALLVVGVPVASLALVALTQIFGG